MTDAQKKLEFSCLCFDTSNQCAFGTEPANLALILRGNIFLFSKHSEISDTEAHSIIKDKTKDLQVAISKLPGTLTADYTSIFYIKCETHDLEKNLVGFDKFRFDLVKYLVEQKFGKIYITKDDLSAHLLNGLYLKINKLENGLRTYVVKHFSITQGVSSWFNQVLDSETNYKVRQRKSNEDLFSILSKEEFLIDTRMYLTDFEDIGNIIYSNSYGNFTAGDLIEKIKSSEDLSQLKSNVQKNIEKYFGSFKDIQFQEKWEFLKIIRHKIAHNSLISLEQKTKAESFLDELIAFVEARDNEKFSSTSLEDEDVDIEKHQSVYRSPYPDYYKPISKNELLREIAEYEAWCNKIGRDFMGLKNFLHNRLGGMGYHIGKAWDELEELDKAGYIKIYIWEDPKKIYPDQKAIRVIKLPVYSA